MGVRRRSRRCWHWLLALACVACGKSSTAAEQQHAGGRSPSISRAATALPSPDPIGSLSHLDPKVARAFEITSQFRPVPTPGPDDWLASHPEPPQSVVSYAGSGPNVPRPPRDTIVIVALSELDGSKGADLDTLVDYGRKFFGVDVRVLEGISMADLDPRRRTHYGEPQVNAADILDALESRIPEDAYCVIALTTEDLYPSEDFNYVFGLARLKRRVGVFSFARYESDNHTLAVERALKVMTHEVGHMFGITHCTHFACNMNGSNHLEELDREPMHLCPVCLRKLHLAADFDPIARYESLSTLYRTQNLHPQALWVDQRLAHIKSGT